MLKLSAENVNSTDAVIPESGPSQVDMCRSSSFNAVFPLRRSLHFALVNCQIAHLVDAPGNSTGWRIERISRISPFRLMAMLSVGYFLERKVFNNRSW